MAIGQILGMGRDLAIRRRAARLRDEPPFGDDSGSAAHGHLQGPLRRAPLDRGLNTQAATIFFGVSLMKAVHHIR